MVTIRKIPRKLQSFFKPLRDHFTQRAGQHLGLGNYRVLRYRAVVRHLHLIDCAYACPTYIGIKIYRVQGQNKSKKVLPLEPIGKLKERMRRIVWQENVQDVIKYSHEKPVIRRLEKLLVA